MAPAHQLIMIHWTILVEKDVSHKSLDPAVVTFCWKRPVRCNLVQLLANIADVDIVPLRIVARDLLLHSVVRDVHLHFLLLHIVARDGVLHSLLLHIEHVAVIVIAIAHTLQLWQGVPSIAPPPQLGG